MEFEELVRNQHYLGAQIETLARNFSKDPKDRKTPAYFVKRLEALTELADEFHNNHKEIMAIEDKPLDDEYFTEGYFDKITQVIVKHTKIFEQGAMKLLELGDEAHSSRQQQDTTQQSAPADIRKILRNQRALIKALTRNIDEVFEQRQLEHHFSYYNIKASIIEKYMMDLAANNGALWALTDDDTIEDYTPELFYELEARAEAAMIELQQHMQSDPQDPHHKTTTAGDSDIPLPRITLPTFDGNYQRWMEFKDIFSELVHNTTISDAKKMHYLTASLQGEPKNLIKHLPAVGINYAAAWTLISNRYDNKRLLVSTLLSKLMSQPSTKAGHASSIRSLHDVTKECIHGLAAQGIPVKHWDDILVHILLHKLDEESQIAFEQGLTDNRRLITLDELLRFLERRFQSLETRGKTDKPTSRTCASITASSGETCKICKKEIYNIYACGKFTNAELNQRWKWVKDLQLCVNCLKPGHRASECKSRHCNKCPKNHNTLLHNPQAKVPTSKTSLQDKSKITEVAHDQTSNKVSLLTNHLNKDSHYILLGTARIKLAATNGQLIECRAILDSGSQVNLITDRLWKKLGGRSKQMCLSVEGIGINKTMMRHQTSIQIQSTINNYVAKVDAHILPKIVSNQPDHQFNIENWGIPQNIDLADPEFNKPGRIDCLLGAEIVFTLLRNGQIKLADNLPVLQNSVLGWVIAGKVKSAITNSAVCEKGTTKELKEAVSRFWEA